MKKRKKHKKKVVVGYKHGNKVSKICHGDSTASVIWRREIKK